MMSNERQRQASTPVVVAKDNLKNRQKQKVTLCKTKQQKTKIQNNKYLPLMASPCNGRIGRNHSARTQRLEFSPNGRMKK